LEPYLNLWHHVYQVNYYNSVEIEEKVLLRKTRVCGTIRANRGDSFKQLKGDDTVIRKGMFFYTSGRIRGRFAALVQYNGTTEEVTSKLGERIKKPTTVIQYKVMKGADRADQYLLYCTILEKKTKKGAKMLCFR
jgi:hypothetical protein